MDKFIVYLIGIFFVIGGVDYIAGNSLKLGEKFEEGIKAMGALGIGMIGIYSLAPLISRGLSMVIKPISRIVNMDASMFSSSFLALDMGGYQIASNLASNKQIGLFSGIVVAASLGATISFTIPVAFGLINKSDEKYFCKGILLGIISIPLGCVSGGLWQGIPIHILIWNLMPIFIFSIILSIGLAKVPKICIRFFGLFSKLILILSISGLILQGVKAICGVTVVSGLAPLSESAYIVVKIAFILGGAYPMLALIDRVFGKKLEKLGGKVGLDPVAIIGILGGLASNLLIFGSYKDMKPKGKVVAAAFGVGGAFVFGGQFGFVSGIAPKMLIPFIISKITAGIFSILLALYFTKGEIV